MSAGSDFTRRLNPVDQNVGSALKGLRISKGLSRAELAARLGVSVGEVRDYELGRTRIGAARLIELAHLLEVRISAFWTCIGHDARIPELQALQAGPPETPESDS